MHSPAQHPVQPRVASGAQPQRWGRVGNGVGTEPSGGAEVGLRRPGGCVRGLALEGSGGTLPGGQTPLLRAALPVRTDGSSLLDSMASGMRLIVSCVSSFLILSLLLFMFHRLRQRRRERIESLIGANRECPDLPPTAAQPRSQGREEEDRAARQLCPARSCSHSRAEPHECGGRGASPGPPGCVGTCRGILPSKDLGHPWLVAA